MIVKSIRSMTYLLHISVFFIYLLASTSLYGTNSAQLKTPSTTNLHKTSSFTMVQDSAKIVLQHKLTQAADDSLKIAYVYFEYGQYLNTNGDKELAID